VEESVRYLEALVGMSWLSLDSKKVKAIIKRYRARPVQLRSGNQFPNLVTVVFRRM
jgi:hypothetical protein